MTDLERMAIWYVAVLFVGFLAMVVETRRACSAPGCDGCGSFDEAKLYAQVEGRWFCCDCWAAAGRPWPHRPATTDEVHEQELRTRQRMTARGGTDCHLVRNGRT